MDKLFLEVNGMPIVGHTWRRFDRCPAIERIVLVVREEMRPAFELLAERLLLAKPFSFAAGGQERQDSVWNGISALPENCEMVAIQDAARPCTSIQLIEATFEATKQTGAAVAAQNVVDTIKESTDGRIVDRTLDRHRLWAVQTPQTFRTSVIRRALEAARAKGLTLTDDTAACELIGQPVALVASTEPNPKVTRPEDLPYVNLLLQKSGSCG